VRHCLDCKEFNLNSQNEPEGLLVEILNVLNFLIMDVKSSPLLTFKEVHTGLVQLLQYLNSTFKQGLHLIKSGKGKDSRKMLIEFLETISKKITSAPFLADLLFMRYKHKNVYLPLQLALLLLIHSPLDEPEQNMRQLRGLILLCLKIENKEVKKYLVEDSEICEILIAKLQGNY